ncbi:Serine/threonine-protein kinase STY8 [Phytophthora ramorum]|uniref:Serine/threonine-protein kinase STY8 n=1 Tax=Phytophthora ramorum TaxID=164328 RepID=UPI0030B093FF|nr:Serine/threonine-protein kinase STY8 [Phytophthora ramorum]
MTLLETVQAGDVEEIERELESGADVNEADGKGYTPLMWAVENDRKDIVQLLLENDATLDLSNRSGRDVFDLATIKDEVLEIVKNHQYEQQNTMVEALPALCAAMNEVQHMSEHLLERLHDTLEGCAGNLLESPSTSCFGIVRGFHTLLLQHSTKLTLERLVSTRTVVGCLRQLHADIDALVDQEATKRHSPLQKREWQQQWEQDESRVYKNLVETLETNAEVIMQEFGSVSRQEDTLKLLKYESEEHERHYSPDLMRVLEAAQTKLIRFSNLSVPEVPSWFIPEYEVQRQCTPFAQGSFGHVYHGTWLESQVVVKCVDPKSEEDKRTFRREARIWQKARHKHIVNFFGACDQGNPWFYVCEEAVNGNLKNYLYRQRQQGRSLAWRKLYEAALGLHFLHQRHIIHSDLKCNQILVSAEGVAMLTDFGLSFMSADSRPRVPPGGAVRWKAPECLKNADQVPTPQSDVYSFGMCVVEAVTGEYPWGQQCPDPAVVFQVKRGLVLPRPRAFENEEHWQFVQALCAAEPLERLQLSDAIRLLKRFADDECMQERLSNISESDF